MISPGGLSYLSHAFIFGLPPCPYGLFISCSRPPLSLKSPRWCLSLSRSSLLLSFLLGHKGLGFIRCAISWFPPCKKKHSRCYSDAAHQPVLASCSHDGGHVCGSGGGDGGWGEKTMNLEPLPGLPTPTCGIPLPGLGRCSASASLGFMLS